MSKKTVLITGSSGGIGLATAKHFSEKGWKVLGIDVVEIGCDFFLHDFVQVDLFDIEKCEALVRKLLRKEGRLDVLVNNAAFQLCKPMTDTGVADFEKVLRINLIAPIVLARLCHIYLKKSGGSIVNVSSVHVVATSKDIGAYAASKSALLSATRSLAIELANDGIRVNAILPGAVDTAMLRAGLQKRCNSESGIVNDMDCLGKKHILKRVGMPAEVATAIYFLADNSQSSFITGQSLIVDGGASIKLSTE